MANTKETPRPSAEREMAPEQREAMRRQYLDAVRELLAADPADVPYLRKQFDDPTSPFRWYILKNSGDLTFDATEQGFKFESETDGERDRGGWLGYQVGDELMMAPADRRFFAETNSWLLSRRAADVLGHNGREIEVFNDRIPTALLDVEPIAFKTEASSGRRDSRPGYYAVGTRGVLKLAGERTAKDLYPAHAQRAREKAARIRAEQQVAVDREQSERTAAERADQLRLLEQARALKRTYDELETKRQEVAAQLERAGKEFPRSKLAQAVSAEFAKLTPDQQKTLRDKKDYRLPSETTLPSLARHREDAGRIRGELGFIEKRLPDGKAMDAYLERIGGMLSAETLQNVQKQEQALEDKSKKFEGEDKTVYEQARQGREQEAATLLDGPIKTFFETRHERTHEYPTRLEEWKKEELWDWMEACQRQEKQRARER